MKPACEPASSRPKPCASLKKPHESCPFAAPCGPRRKKNDRGQTSAFPSETSRFKPVILAHRGSALPWLVDDRAALRLRRIWCVPTDRALPGSPRQCSLPLACRHPPEGHQVGARKRPAPGNTILSQPHHRSLNRQAESRRQPVGVGEPKKNGEVYGREVKLLWTHGFKFKRQLVQLFFFLAVGICCCDHDYHP